MTKKIAKERIVKLFKEAEKTTDIKLKDRYVELARKIAQKSNVRMPKNLKRKYCKHCYSYFIPSKTCSVRITKRKMVSILCLKCRKRTRIPFISEKKGK
tara:strand:+ start:1022 stop:1318 length:297 start_codon:yes stop_codon:yes gene_type:complete